MLVEPDAMPTLLGVLAEVAAEVTEDIRRSEVEGVN